MIKRREAMTALCACVSTLGVAILIGCGGGGGGGGTDTLPSTGGETAGTTATTGSTAATTGSTAGTTGATTGDTTGATTGGTSGGTTGGTSGGTSGGTTGGTSGGTSGGTTGGTSGGTSGGTTGGGGIDDGLTRILQAGDQWVYDVTTKTVGLLGTTVQTAVDTQDVVEVNFKGEPHLAIRSKLLKNLANGGTQLVTTYRVFTQDLVSHTIQLIGMIDKDGKQILLNASTLLPGELDVDLSWNTISKLLASVLTTTYNVIESGDVSVEAGLFEGFNFNTSQLTVPSLSLNLMYTSDGWVSASLGNILKEIKTYIGLTGNTTVEIELQATNVS